MQDCAWENVGRRAGDRARENVYFAALLAFCLCSLFLLFRRRSRVVVRILHAPGDSPAARAVREVGGTEGFLPTPWMSGPFSGHLHTFYFGFGLGSPPVGPTEEVTWVAADGGTSGLSWPACSAAEDSMVVLFIPGLCGTQKSAGGACAAIRFAGARPAVLLVRGSMALPLTSARFNLLGSTDEVRDALRHVRKRYPRAPIALIGNSAGTGLMIRYLGEEGAAAPVVAAFANCPGYDPVLAMSRVSPLYDGPLYLARIKRNLLSGAPAELLNAADADAFDRCQRARTLHDFFVAAAPFAGPGWDFKKYLLECNPMRVAHRVVVPTLVLNSEDDPICVAANIDEHQYIFTREDSAPVLLRVSRGGHCGFFEGAWRPRSWAYALGLRFVQRFARG